MGRSWPAAAVLLLTPVAPACSDGTLIDTAAECIESFQAGLADIEDPPDLGEDAVGRGSFQDDDWEGRTPMCWVDVESGGVCYLFALDINGRWGPDQWRFDIAESRSCGQGHGEEFEL